MFLLSDLFVEKDTPYSVMVLNNDIGTKMLKKSDHHQLGTAKFRTDSSAIPRESACIQSELSAGNCIPYTFFPLILADQKTR